LGHNLGLGIVAEGVSSETQLEFLRAEGCDAVQGWLMSAAMPANEFAELVRRPRATVAEPERVKVQPMRRTARAR
jgi:EAL domain-containing protein (putative c-di-GMP-specific phosphodiesterase class I)